MLGRSDIAVGNFRVGRISADSAAVQGEGGELSPALAVPLSLQLDPQREEESIAVTEIEADLVLSTQPGTGLGTQVGSPARSSAIGVVGGLWRTVPGAPSERQLTLRFVLAREQVRLLEDHAHRLGAEPVPLELRLRLGAAWVRQSTSAPSPGPANHPVPAALGFVSDLWRFSETRVEPLRIELAREDWATRILPALGGDRIRLVAVRFPNGDSPLGHDAIAAFDAARSAYDAGEYRRAVQACRDLREAVEDDLEATDGIRLADQVGERLGWAEDSPARDLLDNLWKTLVEVSSAANHQRGRQLSVADARLAVLIAAGTMEYLTELIEPETT
ncbi:MAG TPA: hypothetical protein VG518_10825 [Solirubrobacterales bacterium]|nr:hypothetical protein [Solirubrobacterales bacterium]